MPKIAVLLLIICLAVTACQPSPITAAASSAAVWRYADLATLDALDASEPEGEILAAYARLTRLDLEIRLDLLETKHPLSYELSCQLDFGAGNSWKIIFPPESSEPVVQTSQGSTLVKPRLTLDTEMDTLTLRLSRAYLPNLSRLIITAAISKNGSLLDSTGAFTLQGQPPARAPLLLAFWDALPAATPAQALRRWDGAHTGPYGQRHGLAVLLQAAREAGGVPLALLDLKKPGSLAAVHLLGNEPDLRAMEKRGELILPLAAYGDPLAAQTALSFSRRAAGSQRVDSSSMVFGAVPLSLASGYPAAFARLEDATHTADYRGQRLIPLPVEDGLEQVSTDGLSRGLISDLLQTALSTDPDDLMVLGGSLPGSPWADSTIAPLVFRWLANHPWVQVLNENALMQLPPVSLSNFHCADLLCSPSVQTGSTERAGQLREQLNEMPAGAMRDSAWLAYLNLTAPTDNPQLAAMQISALEQIGYFIAASAWEKSPAEQTTCEADPDQDGENECILASKSWFTILELNGGRMAFGAVRGADGVIEIIGDSSQVSLGLGEPAEWHPERGAAADPQVIPGAFADSSFPWAMYESSVQPGEIRLTHPQSGLIKSFQLLEDTLKVTAAAPSGTATELRIPLIIAPNQQLDSGWQPRAVTPVDGGFDIQLNPTEGISLSSPTLALTSAFDSLESLTQREDPNTGYPPGHYLPFPLLLIQAQTIITISITGANLR